MENLNPVVDRLTQLMLGEMQQPVQVGVPQYELPATPHDTSFFTPMQQGLIQAGAALSQPLTAERTINTNIAQAASAIDSALNAKAQEDYANQLKRVLLQAQLDATAAGTGQKKKSIRAKNAEMNLRRAQTIATLQDAEAKKEALKEKGKGKGSVAPVLQEWRTLAQTLMALNPERYKDNPALAMHDAYKQMKLANKKVGEGAFSKVLENMIFALNSEEGRQFFNEMLKTAQQYQENVFAVPGAGQAGQNVPPVNPTTPTPSPQIPVNEEAVKSWLPKVIGLSDEELQKVVARDFNAYYAALLARGKHVPLKDAYVNWLKYYGEK